MLSQLSQDIDLMMECHDDQLSEVQITAFKKAEEEYNIISKTVDIINNSGELLYQNNGVSLTYIDNKSFLQDLTIIPDEEVISTIPGAASVHEFPVPLPPISVTSHFLHHTNSKYENNQQCPGIATKNSSAEANNSQILLSTEVGMILSKQNYIVPGFVNNNACGTVLNPMNSSSFQFNNELSSGSTITGQIAKSEMRNLLNESKMFPTLAVSVKPQFIINSIISNETNVEQNHFDENITEVLALTAERFTEWLLRKRLLYTNQFCRKHAVGGQRSIQMKLKLGYSNKRKFPQSGGFVWVSECCPQTHLSVFKGSIFDPNEVYSPAVLLRLIYHWSCRTDISSVMKWEKVPIIYIRKFYTYLRGTCIAAIHDEYKNLLGGNNKTVEVGVVSLGLINNNKQKVVVWILGVLESETKFIRLLALEPSQSKETAPTRFSKLLGPLDKIVNKNSVILTDPTLDRNTFINLGYKSIRQNPVRYEFGKPIFFNENIVKYLSKCTSSMFKNTLPFLSRQIIQQFLDELVWRERWGQTLSRALRSIIRDIGNQTKINPDSVLPSTLLKIAFNPFMNWQYSNWQTNLKLLKANSSVEPKQNNNLNNIQLLTTTDESIILNSNLNNSLQVGPLHYKMVQCELTKLESYYYGVLFSKNQFNRNCKLNAKCVLCSKVMETNILMMRHLINHAVSPNSNHLDAEDDKFWCTYCLAVIKSGSGCLHKHIEETHLRAVVSPRLRCLICKEDFKYRTKLILHMHCNHNEAELPYECEACKFRSSQHHTVIDHFYKTHRNSEIGQCPLCLKTVTFKYNGHEIRKNIYLFYSHIKQHFLNKFALKCSKCILSFINNTQLECHQWLHHRSCKAIPNLKRYESNKTTMMPIPTLTMINRLGLLQTQKLSDLLSKYFIYKERFNIRINIDNSLGDLMCYECKGYLLETNHFSGHLMCNKCPFNTNCDKVMIKHILRFHEFDSDNSEFRPVNQITLKECMHCVCGFKSNIGDKLATHMIKCGRKSVYISEESAFQNSIELKPSVVFDQSDSDTNSNDSIEIFEEFIPYKQEYSCIELSE